MITKKTKYALNALKALGRNKGNQPKLISDLANTEKIPQKFLEQILVELKKQGILQSRKGKGGGYFLARPADTIMLGEVIRITEGPLALVPCVSEKLKTPVCEECKDPKTCGLRVVMKQLRDQAAGLLDKTSIQSVLDLEVQLKIKVSSKN